LKGWVVDFFKRRDGAALAELAVVIPVLGLLLLGVVDFGRAYTTSSVVANAAAAGASYGSQDSTSAYDASGIRAAALQDAADIDTATVTSRAYCSCGAGSETACTNTCTGYGAPRMFVDVTVSRTFFFLIDFPGLPDSIVMTRVAKMRVK
jgi:Flp pilus assembly protein TadG